MRVRTPRPDGRMPPVLDVALDELPRRGAQQVLAGDVPARDGQCHDILELVTEAIGPARLVEGRSSPDPAGSV